ncbi:MAG: cytidine deaminase [Bacteroidota bacterium]
MANHHHEIRFQRFEDSSELEAFEAELLAHALTAAKQAYAPFSRFHVGCAVRLADASIVLGNNQENRAFPSGLCAERTALFHLGSIGKGHLVRTIAIRAYSEKKDIPVPVTPCGACRQVMVEYEQLGGNPWVVLMQGSSGHILRVTGVQSSLLPFGFDIDFE